jgi:clan AA aspartic protease (TIGR02281 family)
MYANGHGVAQDYAQAIAWYRRAADQGNADAQANLGAMYEVGQGVAQDYAQAIAWYRRAADQGNADAQADLGAMYANGHGVAQDDAQALIWLRKAADHGNADAQANLGAMYEMGRGVAQDYAQAVAWYRKAADQGNVEAQANLGLAYRNGQGEPQDYAQALIWFRKAADQGNADAQGTLGAMYANGLGVRQDYVRAHMWLNLAAARPDDATRQMAVKARDDVAVKMTPDQIVEAQRMASEWMQAHEPPVAAPPISGMSESAVPMVRDGGTFKVPVTINGQLTLEFVVDSGAADVSIPADVVMTLLRTGTITDADFLDKQTYQLADGSTVPSQRIVIHTLKIGDNTLENVVGSIAPAAGSLLLGQSFLGRFKAWSIDNQRRALILNGMGSLQRRIGVLPQGHRGVHLEVGDVSFSLHSNRVAKIVFQKSADGEAMLNKAFDAWRSETPASAPEQDGRAQAPLNQPSPDANTPATPAAAAKAPITPPSTGPRSDEVGANAPFSAAPMLPFRPKARPAPADPTERGLY